MKKYSLESQLGFYVGEYIYQHFLPTLSTDKLKSRKVVQVSEEDAVENARLETVWAACMKSNDSETEEWKAYYNHNKMLELKYLPHVLKCHIPQIYVENIEEFKKGLIDSLWNSDLCVYSLKPENIKIGSQEKYFTSIEFALGSTVND